MRDDSVERLGIRQVAAILFCQRAVARQDAGDLPRAVGAEVEVNAAVVVANRGHRLAAIV